MEQDAAVRQLSTSKEQLQAKIDQLLAAKQQLELALATARSSVTSQEQVVASMLERLSAAAPVHDVVVKKASEGVRQSAKGNSKDQWGHGLNPVSAGFLYESLPTL